MNLVVPVVKVTLEEGPPLSVHVAVVAAAVHRGQAGVQGREHPLTPLVVEHLPLTSLLLHMAAQCGLQLLGEREMGEREMGEREMGVREIKVGDSSTVIHEHLPRPARALAAECCHRAASAPPALGPLAGPSDDAV